jgi:hypothetical protein
MKTLIEPRRPQWPMRRRAGAMALGLLILATAWCGPASAEDAPGEPRPIPWLEELFRPVKEKVKPLTPFIGDTDLRVHFRTYYLNRHRPDDTNSEALAAGGWLSYKSGWLFDVFSMGATFYGSAPLWAPPDRDGTLLLRPGQEGYYVPGEAWGAVRFEEYAQIKGYRQLVDQGYINPADNRMTPNTFQGVTVGGKVGWLQYLGGYLLKIKPRNADRFISMSQQAGGGEDSDDGVGMGGVRLTPIEGLRIDVSNQYGVNTFNTVFAEVDYLVPLSENWKLRLGVQYTDQRAVGDALLPAAESQFWATANGAARVQLIYDKLTLTGAFSKTGSGNTIQTPWGSFPGYLSMIDQDFNRAREGAVLFGAAYDFSRVIAEGLSANFNLVWGWNAINHSTRQRAPNQREYDFTADYRPPFKLPVLQGMWFRFRSAVVDQDNASTLGYQFRIIINWERDLI